jgi:hypothetical protein
MAAAALTPRVRIMAVCDGVRESETEAGVFHLKSVRQAIHGHAFPFVPHRLWLFLLLSSPRRGNFPGYVLVSDRNDQRIFYGHLSPRPTFNEGVEFLPYRVRLRCTFPEPGRYTIQLCFFREQGSDVVKGEIPFDVLSEGE